MASNSSKGRLFLLAALVAVLVVLVATIWPAGTADTTGSGVNRPRDPQVAPEADPAVPPAVGLDKLHVQRAAPASRRDLFRFGADTPVPAEEAGESERAPEAGRPAPGGAGQQDEPPAVPAGPPPPAPIPLRYVGYAETPGSGKVAALSDGRFMYHGRVGDVIEGRWRVVEIGVESLVIERVDGTGRQTLRLQ